MALLRRFVAGLRGLVRGQDAERELDAELRAFLQDSINDKLRAGMPREDAERAARIELGSVAAVKDRVRDVGWETVVESVVQDVRYGVRTLRRSPGFAVVAIAMLALAIGANTAIFSLVNVLLLRDLPVREPQRLVQFMWQYPGDPPMDVFPADSYRLYRDRNTVFADVIGTMPFGLGARTDGPGDEKLRGEYVTGNYFTALGLRAALGRLPGPDDDRAGSPPVAVVSWTYWTTRFTRDPAVLNAHIAVEGVPATVIGVAPRDFTGLALGYAPDVWMPAAARHGGPPPLYALLARLKDGTSVEQARAEMRVLDRARIETFARTDPQWRTVTLDVESARYGLSTPLHQQFGQPLRVLMAIVCALLLLACANIAGMLLARGAARQREMAVRISLGAGRLRIIRQVLTESLLLAAAGSVVGIAGAHAAAGAMVRIVTSGTRTVHATPSLDVPLDTQVLLFATAVTVIAAVLFGLAPAWAAFASAPSSELRAAGVAGQPRSRRIVGNGLVVAQVAVSLVLLTLSDVYIAHLSNLRNRDLGFNRGALLLAGVDVAAGANRDQSAQMIKELLGRFEAIPGVRSVTVSGMTPISGAAGSRFVTVEGFDEAPQSRRRVLLNGVAPRYFETYGTPIIAGRDFLPTDEGGPRVAIVNHAMARHYFAGRDPLGTHIVFEGDSRPYEIIGVAADAKYADVRAPAPQTIYLDCFQQSRVPSEFTLRTSVPPAAVAASVRQAVGDVMKGAPATRLTTMTEQVDASIVPERLIATLSGFFGMAGMLLAVIGLYGLLAYTVARRTSEIGVRMALGASSGDVTRMVLTNALWLVSAGLLLGAPAALWSKRIAAAMIENLTSNGAAATLVAAAALISVTLAAAYLPARRAARVNPIEALRAE